MRVLLVEDEQPLAKYVAAGLRRHGFAVDVALDGRTALDKCAVTPYDVVVLDRDLPVVHGDTVCRELAEDGTSRILMLTRVRHGRGPGRRAHAGRGRLPWQAVRVLRARRQGARAVQAQHAGSPARAPLRRPGARPSATRRGTCRPAAPPRLRRKLGDPSPIETVTGAGYRTRPC